MTGSQIAVWAAIACAIFIPLMANGRRGEKCKGRGGWIWAFTIPPLVIFGFLVVAKMTYRASYVSQQDMQATLTEQSQADIEAKANVMKHVGGETHVIAQQSMQQAWDELHKSRIALETKLSDTANGESSVSEENSNSLARSIERLEVAAERMAQVADQVADVGTIIGRTMVALNSSLGSQAAASAATPTAEAQADDKVKSATAKVFTANNELVDAKVELVVETPADDASTANAPAWIDDPPKRVGNTWREVLITDEFATDPECRTQADELLMQATSDYMKQFANRSVEPIEFRGDGTESFQAPTKEFRALNQMGIGIDFVRREIARDEYEETVQRSFGPMKKVYTLVEFTPSVQNELRRRWEVFLRQQRFAIVGLGAGSVLSVIGFAYGLLKVDTWTKGYYSKRLFLGVPAAIIGAIALLFALSVIGVAHGLMN